MQRGHLHQRRQQRDKISVFSICFYINLLLPVAHWSQSVLTDQVTDYAGLVCTGMLKFTLKTSINSFSLNCVIQHLTCTPYFKALLSFLLLHMSIGSMPVLQAMPVAGRYEDLPLCRHGTKTQKSENLENIPQTRLEPEGCPGRPQESRQTNHESTQLQYSSLVSKEVSLRYQMVLLRSLC